MLNITRFSLSFSSFDPLRGRKLTDQKWRAESGRSIGKLNDVIHNFTGPSVILITARVNQTEISSCRRIIEPCILEELRTNGGRPWPPTKRVRKRGFRRYGTIEWRNRRWERERFERRNYTGCVLGFAAHTLKKSRRAYIPGNPRRNEGETINRVCKRFFNLEFHSWPAILMVDSRFILERFRRREKKRKKKTLDHM